MQRKLRPFAEILILVNSLSDDQKADLLDVLRGRPQRAERKASKRTEPAKAKLCATCGNPKEFADHAESSDSYHIFRTEVKRKAAGATP